MATLITKDEEEFEFELVCISEMGPYLCYLENPRNNEATPAKIFPESSVRQVLPEESVEKETSLVEIEGKDSTEPPVDTRKPLLETRILVDLWVY